MARMVVNRVRTAQRKRRKREALEKEQESIPKKETKKPRPAQPATSSSSNQRGTQSKPIPKGDFGDSQDTPICVEDDKLSKTQKKKIED